MDTQKLIVAKFGGTSLATAERIAAVREIVRANPARRTIVVSAPGARHPGDPKITDLLLQLGEERELRASNALSRIRNRFGEICSELRPTRVDLSELFQTILTEADALRAEYGREDLRAFLVSRGEWLMAQILADLLDYTFIDASACIRFNEHGKYHHELTRHATELVSLHELARTGIVVPGFYGATNDGLVRTFPRNGSDISAAVLAQHAHADVYENWTDTNGILAADPRIVLTPRTVHRITYDEARELTFSGASVLHPAAIGPARMARIPVNVRNTFDPDSEGTWIVAERRTETWEPFSGVFGKAGHAVISIGKYAMDEEVGFLARAALVLAEAGLSVHNCPGSVDTLSFIVDSEALAIREDVVLRNLKRVLESDDIKVIWGIAIICVVGLGMMHRPGSAGKITTALGNKEINIVTLNQGSSENNIEIGVLENDREPAIRAIYNGLFRNE